MASKFEALLALEQVRRARATMRHYPLPWAYHPAFGLVVAMIVLGQGLSPMAAIACSAAALLGGFALFRWARVRTGRTVTGLQPGRARWITAALILAFWLLLSASATALWGDDAPMPLPIATAAMFLIATIGSVGWTRVYRDDVQEER